MLQAVTTATEAIRVNDVAAPAFPGTGHTLIEVERVGICGSDGHVYEGTHPYLGYPQVQGHEIVGRVIVTDPGGDGPPAGVRVVVEPARGCGSCIACRRDRENCCTALGVIGVTLPGGLQEQLIVPTTQLHDVGDLSADAAVFAEPFSIATHALRRARLRDDDSVLVLGAGSIGMTVALAAAAFDLPTVIADQGSGRRQLFTSVDEISAVAFDLAEIRRVLSALTPDGCPTVIIDTTGAPEVLATAVELVAPSGTIVVVGISEGDLVAPVATMTRKELSIVGARNSRREFPRAIELARQWEHITTSAIQHRYPLVRAEEAVALVAHRRAVGKVVVEIGAER